MKYVFLIELTKSLAPIVLSLIALWRGYRNRERLKVLENQCQYPSKKCEFRIRSIEAKEKENG